jgi:hypothetical protein
LSGSSFLDYPNIGDCPNLRIERAIVELGLQLQSGAPGPIDDGRAAAFSSRKKLECDPRICVAVKAKSILMGAPFRSRNDILQPNWSATDVLADCEQHRDHCLIVVPQELLAYQNGDLGAKLRLNELTMMGLVAIGSNMVW